MARPESTSIADWPVEHLAEHVEYTDPLADFPPPEAQGQMMMEFVHQRPPRRW
ncbi:MAG: hypothetical protein ACE5H9_04570 [Anaerolineae bacterium]